MNQCNLYTCIICKIKKSISALFCIIKKFPLIIIGSLFVLSALIILIYLDHASKNTWYILITLGLIIIFYKEIVELNFLGLKLKLREAKEELNIEGDKILVKMLITSLVHDSSDKQQTLDFFYEDKIDSTKEIFQSTDYMLSQLQKMGFIKYNLKNNAGKTNNSTADAKKPYIVTIKNRLEIK